MLQNQDTSKAKVLRNGKEILVESEELVPGDIVFINKGDKIPADIRILKENSLEINESTLTGEWAPTSKQATTLTIKRPIAERINMLWKGTIAVGGKGRGVVVATGKNTAFGKFAEELKGEKTLTPLQKQTKSLARLIMFLITVAVLLIVGISLLKGIALNEIILTAVAIGIAGIPSGLPAAITIVLVIGMRTIFKNNGLIRNLLGAETLGSTTWILTDKTGTLTEGKMSLSEIIYIDKKERINNNEITPKGREIIFNSFLATDGNKIPEKDGFKFTGKPVEQAFYKACEEVCTIDKTREKRIAFLPFDSELRYSSSLIKEQSGEMTYLIIGAPEVIIEKSKRLEQNNKNILFTTSLKNKLLEINKKEGVEGKRTLALAKATFNENIDDNFNNLPPDSQRKYLLPDKKELVFLSLLSINDVVREDVSKSVKLIRDANIKISMVTGDGSTTALSIAKESGILKNTEEDLVLEGDEIDKLDDLALFETAKRVKVFARMLPNQKARLLKVLLEQGEVVAMTGDGVNDAAALQRASIGIAVESGTDVAKESADLILLKNSFSTITDAIVEGRRIITNLKKITTYLLSTSFSEAVLVAGGLLFFSALPIVPVQILWANIIEEAFISFAFAFGKEVEDIKGLDPHDESVNTIISKNVRKMIIILSITTGFFLLSLFAFLNYFTNFSIEQMQTVMFVAVAIDSIFLALSIKNLKTPIYKANLFDNVYLIGAILISILIFTLVFLIPELSVLLHIEKLPLGVFWIIPIAGIFHIFVVEIIKLRLFRSKKAFSYK